MSAARSDADSASTPQRGWTPPVDSGRLQLKRTPTGDAHFLCGKQVLIGEEIELLLGEGRWLSGQYEWEL